jgi:hypothetical protein
MGTLVFSAQDTLDVLCANNWNHSGFACCAQICWQLHTMYINVRI